jgi:enterochelin esterase-like enzyme
MTIIRPRLRLRRCMSVMVPVTFCVSAALAQERPLQPVVQGDLAPGVAQIYTLRANAGDVISGTLEMKDKGATPPFTVALYDESGSKMKERTFQRPPFPIAFVIPKNAVYQIRITATGPMGGSYTLRTEQRTPAERMAGAAAVTPIVSFRSARIDELAKDVSAGQVGAVEHFWSEAEAHGGPLVETIEGNDQDVLVTFLWKEIYETRNVLAIWPGPAPQDYYMSLIPGTNVWYKTVRVRRGSRFGYALAPNNRSENRDALTAQRDPLNPRFAAGGRSILETPGAPDESWYRRTPSVRGTITEHHLDSVLLKGRRDVSVYTPPGYAPANGPYPLLILFDGSTYATGSDDFGGLWAPNTLDNLIADHRIRPTVVCFVSDNRSNMAKAKGIPTYATAMATELVPWLRSSYAVSTDPKDVVIGGLSAGASMAGFVALQYPTVFGNVLLQSGGQQPLPPLYLEAPKVPVRFYIDMGLHEYLGWEYLAPDEQAVTENPLIRMRHFRDVLQAKGYDVMYKETGGSHEDIHWRATLAEGLIALLGQPAK